MRCKLCRLEIREIEDLDGERKPLYVHEEENKEWFAHCGATRRPGEFPWHIPEFRDGPGFIVPKFARLFLAACCESCDEQFEVEYTRTRGLGGALPEEDAADHIRDVWMMTHVIEKHPDLAH